MLARAETDETCANASETRQTTLHQDAEGVHPFTFLLRNLPSRTYAALKKTLREATPDAETKDDRISERRNAPHVASPYGFFSHVARPVRR